MNTELQIPWQHEGRFWLDPGGTVYPVPCSHEEWAIEFVGTSLERLFEMGWIRLQAFRGRYLFIDHQQAVTAAQADALLEFFFDRDNLIPYDRMVVERHCHDLHEFPAGHNRAAYVFVCTRCLAGTEIDSP